MVAMALGNHLSSNTIDRLIPPIGNHFAYRKLNLLTFNDESEVRALFSKLIGHEVDDSFLLATHSNPLNVKQTRLLNPSKSKIMFG